MKILLTFFLLSLPQWGRSPDLPPAQPRTPAARRIQSLEQQLAAKPDQLQPRLRNELAMAYAQRALAASRAHLLAFRCAACGALAAEWADRCPACGAWNTLMDCLEPRRGAAEPAKVPTSAEA